MASFSRADRRRSVHHFQDMVARARERGGECLSDPDDYRTLKSILRWRCGRGHVWETAAAIVASGGWCGRCAKMRATIEDMRTLARRRGGDCLSRAYLGNLEKLEWRCARGHVFRTTPNTVKGGSWCRVCALGIHTIGEMRELARGRGGRCLSPEYRGTSEKLRWRCAEGHEWEAVPSHVQRGSWCPRCAGRVQDLGDMHALARLHGGACESKRYRGSGTALSWKCAEGHRFRKAPSLIKQGFWCPECSPRREMTFERVQKAAAARGGRCVSLGEAPSRRCVLECAGGHRWETMASHVVNGHWCARCAGTAKGQDARAENLERMRAVAAERCGRCLSTTYRKTRARLRWECALGHQFEATPAAVAQGRWCLTCKRMFAVA